MCRYFLSFCSDFVSLCGHFLAASDCLICLVVMCLCHGSSSVGMFSKLSIDVNHKEVLCGLGSSENLEKKKCL